MNVNPKLRASIATDQNPIYECFAPLTAAVWRYRIGFEPLITLVGRPDDWITRPRSNLVLHTLRNFGFIEPTFVDVPRGYRSANVAQIARMYAPIELDPEDVAITADIDMWPLDRDWFCRYLPDPGKVTSYYANFPSRFPMCYVAANAATWFELHGLDRRDYWGEVSRATTDHMLQHLTPDTAAPDAWQHDEEYLTARIHALGPERLTPVKRPAGDPFPDRIDRVNWPARLELGGKKDAHLLRPAYATWFRVGELFEMLCPTLMGWADRYIANYQTLLREDQA